jgi:DNA-binding NarL/FixJ family response regulator
MLNILIACDHKISREALAKVLSSQPLFRVIGVCADTHAAIAITAREQPHIVFIDGSTDPLAAAQATKKIVTCSTANVIAISRQMDPRFACHMMAAGALGYLTSQSSTADIITAVNEVAKDNAYSCLENNLPPIPTPERFSAFKKSIAFIHGNTHKKIAQAVGSHWHGILQFTN